MKRIVFLALVLVASLTQAATITDVRVSGAGPVSFGQVFAVGDLKKSDVLVGAIGTTAVPLQVDVKATHADGSVRHAIISAQVPKAGTMQLDTGGTVINYGTIVPVLPAVVASATIGGIKYSASPSGTFKASWLQGPIVNEWQSAVPLTTAAGVAHPHLTARFAIRYYTASKAMRVDVAIESNWAYEPAPQNFTYDADISIAGKSVYSKVDLTHLTHARWRKVFWYGMDAAPVIVKPNTAYLIASKAAPNYDQSFTVSDAPLAAIASKFTPASAEPMGIGLAVAYMPTTGGRDDIGLLPMWSVAYLLSMDERARVATLGTADLAGSWAAHYRDRNTDRPLSLLDYPAISVGARASDTYNATTKKFEAVPECATPSACVTPYQLDTAHQANFAYLPYLVTGDYYYLEELQFWAMWNVFGGNPAYRQYAKGLVISDQVRGQAWSLRTLAEAAYITPDNDLLKPQLETILDSNLTWFNDTYVSTPATSNKLGVLVNGYALSYQNSTGIAPWQDDFFTAAVGHAADLGYSKASTLLAWKATAPVIRMTDPGTCWIDGALYALVVKPSATGSVYSTFGEAFKASHTVDFNALPCNSQAMATLLGVQVGEMTGYSSSVAGYPSNMQPALAYAVDAGLPKSKEAWSIFQARTVKPDYSNGPQFAIVPRSLPSAPPAAQTDSGTWVKIGNENDKLTVLSNTLVRFGANGKFIQKIVSGAFTANYVFFGGDPINGTVKIVEAFMPAVSAPTTPESSAKPGKVTTGSNVKLAKLTGLTVAFIDPAKFAIVKTFTGVTATTKGAFTVSDVLLVPGTQYLVAVISSDGKPLDAFLLTVPK